MKEKQDGPGLGRVIYSVDDSNGKASLPEERAGQSDSKAEVEVAIADEESFPASDPPGFVGRTKTECD